MYIWGSFFFDAKDIRSLKLKAIWDFSKAPWFTRILSVKRGARRVFSIKAWVHRDNKGSKPMSIKQVNL